VDLFLKNESKFSFVNSSIDQDTSEAFSMRIRVSLFKSGLSIEVIGCFP